MRAHCRYKAAKERRPFARAPLLSGQANGLGYKPRPLIRRSSTMITATTSKMWKKYLEESKLFSVDIVTTAKQGSDPNFKPEFSKYNVVLSNYNGARWPKETDAALLEFVKNGAQLYREV